MVRALSALKRDFAYKACLALEKGAASAGEHENDPFVLASVRIATGPSVRFGDDVP